MKRTRTVEDEVQVLVIGMEDGIPARQKLSREEMRHIESQLEVVANQLNGQSPCLVVVPAALGIVLDRMIYPVILDEITGGCVLIEEKEEFPFVLRDSNHDVVGIVWWSIGGPAVSGVVDFAVLRLAPAGDLLPVRAEKLARDEKGTFYGLLVQWFNKQTDQGRHDIDVGQILLMEGPLAVADGESARRWPELDFQGLRAWEIGDSVVVEVDRREHQTAWVGFDEGGMIEVSPVDEE